MGSETTRALSGGVSCDVWIERAADGTEIVVKQALPKLKVAADWRANPERYEVEVRALAAIRDLLGEQIAPRVLWVDAANHRFAMERIDARLHNWKSELLSGRVDLPAAVRVGELLGLMQTRSADRADLAIAFHNRVYFEELRIEPFFERVAARNPGLASGIAVAISHLREPGITFVHGDFSPKNLLVNGSEVVMLDLEIAHWGNPRFDVAFCLSHLLLKGMRQGVDSNRYAAAALAFLEAYRANGMPVLDAALVRILGCLMLARFDGASPVDYRTQLDAVRTKGIASELILYPSADVSAALEKSLGQT
jgi:5-methylthioribose kinase